MLKAAHFLAFSLSPVPRLREIRLAPPTELYRIIMGVHTLDIPLLESEAEKIVKPILRVISDYGIEGKRQIHYQRLMPTSASKSLWPSI